MWCDGYNACNLVQQAVRRVPRYQEFRGIQLTVHMVNVMIAPMVA